MNEDTNGKVVDDQETTQEKAQSMLVNLCDEGFNGSAMELALVLGRETEEIESLLKGDEDFDEDLIMKMRGIAENRGLELED